MSRWSSKFSRSSFPSCKSGSKDHRVTHPRESWYSSPQLWWKSSNFLEQGLAILTRSRRSSNFKFRVLQYRELRPLKESSKDLASISTQYNFTQSWRSITTIRPRRSNHSSNAPKQVCTRGWLLRPSRLHQREHTSKSWALEGLFLMLVIKHFKERMPSGVSAVIFPR
jgi:hypothetical protein